MQGQGIARELDPSARERTSSRDLSRREHPPMSTREIKYTPFYCEENIWHLGQDERFRERQPIVAMISGHGRYRKLWFQRQSNDPGIPVLWDYHVVLLSFDGGWWVWDPDSTLGFPVPAATYFGKTFLHSGVDAERVDVVLRLIDAQEYVRDFSSDRSHMRTPGGGWVAESPLWPPILHEKRSNLLQWLDVSRPTPGKLMTLSEFMQSFPGLDSNQ